MGVNYPPNVSESHTFTYTGGSTPATTLAIETYDWERITFVPPTQPAVETEKPEVQTEDTSILCNCYLYVKSELAELPNTTTIKNNLSDRGNVAVFYYPSSGLYHYALVTGYGDGYVTINETNFKSCEFSSRVIDDNYPYLIGFYQV